MMAYLLRKLWHSIWVLLGVLLLTFALFQMAAGDPAAAVLGKNPAPVEVENLRRELSGDLPLFYGHWRTSEVYAHAVLTGKARNLPGVTLPEKAQFTGQGVAIPEKSSVAFKRRFAVPEKVQLMLSGRGAWHDNCGNRFTLTEKTVAITADAAPETWELTADSPDAELAEVEAFRHQHSGWNSQFAGAIQELVTLKRTFPYVSILNFGRTVTTREPINRIIARGVGPSLSLMLPIFFGEMLFGIALALLAAAFKDSLFDRLLLIVAVGGMSISYLVLIIAGQWFFGYRLGWFPVWGWSGMRFLVLPVIIGIASGLGGGVRFYRTLFVNELKSEYLRTAAAKGCNGWTVYASHLLRNTLVPIVARASALLPFIFTGSLLLESFFGIPGLGYASVDALNNSDLALLKALTIVNALLFVVINLAADLLCAWVDPRIRLDK